MHIRTRTPIAALIGGTILLSACATPPGAPMTPEQQQLHASNNRFNSTVAEGAAVGAVGGALIGYLSGGTKGALIGAGAGLATGGAAGYLVAQNNYTQARTEQNYRTAIADAQTQAAALQKDATLSETVAAQAMSRAAELNAQYRAHTISAEQYRSSIAQYENTIHDLDAKNAAAQQQISALQKSIAVTPASQAAPFRDALHTIEQDNKRIAAAKERLRQVTLSAPASA